MKRKLIWLLFLVFCCCIKADAYELCRYNGKNDENNYEVTINYEKDKGYAFCSYKNGKAKDCYNDIWFRAEDLKGGTYVGAFGPVSGVAYWKHYIYISDSAWALLKQGKCPDNSFYTLKNADDFCFQNSSDGSYCNDNNASAFKMTKGAAQNTDNSNGNTPGNNSDGSSSDDDVIENREGDFDPDKERITIKPTDNICEGTFYKNGQKTEFAKILQIILNVIKYAAPVLVLVFSIADFVKAVASQDKDALNKATKNSAFRLIIAVVLYFLPLLINFLINLFLGIKDPTCGIL